MNKHTAVLECLKKTKKGITSLEDIIKDNFEECVDRFGNTARYKRYWIVGSVYDSK